MYVYIYYARSGIKWTACKSWYKGDTPYMPFIRSFSTITVFFIHCIFIVHL